MCGLKAPKLYFDAMFSANPITNGRVMENIHHMPCLKDDSSLLTQYNCDAYLGFIAAYDDSA